MIKQNLENRLNRLERIAKKEGFFSDLKQAWADDLHDITDPIDDEDLIDECSNLVDNINDDAKSAMRLATKTENEELITKMRDLLNAASYARNYLNKLS